MRWYYITEFDSGELYPIVVDTLRSEFTDILTDAIQGWLGDDYADIT